MIGEFQVFQYIPEELDVAQSCLARLKHKRCALMHSSTVQLRTLMHCIALHYDTICNQQVECHRSSLHFAVSL